MIEEAANDARVQVSSQPDSLEEDHRVTGETGTPPVFVVTSELEITIFVLSRHRFYDFVKSRHWNA